MQILIAIGPRQLRQSSRAYLAADSEVNAKNRKMI